MALKKNEAVEGTASTAGKMAAQAQGSQVVPTDTTGAITTNGGEDKPKGRGGRKGPRGPSFPWDTKTHDVRLRQVLEAPGPLGSIKTAASVHSALMTFPEFQNTEPAFTSQMVQSRVAAYQKALGDKAPAYLKLDKGRRSKLDLGVFAS